MKKIFDTQAITRSLAEFVKYRNNIIQRCEIRNGQGKEQRNMGRENYLVYLTELQKAAYGNKESREYMRIRDDRELAMSVAMCAKSASDNEFVQDVISQVKVYTKTDKVYLEGTLKRIKENKE